MHRFYKEMGLVRFLKDWTLPVAIATGTICYLTFYYTPQLDELGDMLSPVFDVLFPISVFLTLFVTFCKVECRCCILFTSILMNN